MGKIPHLLVIKLTVSFLQIVEVLLEYLPKFSDVNTLNEFWKIKACLYPMNPCL